MKSRPIGVGQNIFATQNNDRRDDARGGGFLLAHQQLGALALGTNPTNGQTVTVVVNGTSIVATFVTVIGSTPNNIVIGASAAASVQNLLNWLRRPDLTTSTQVAASGANQTLLSYVGWAWPGSGTTVVPFSLNKNVNGITGGLTSFNITTTVTSGSWTAQTMQLYIEDGTYFIGTTRVLFTGGSTPTFTAPSSHPRIDLVTADSSGTIALVTGTESVTPSAPSYPTGKVVICEVYHVVSETALYDNENQQSGQGYVYNDVRQILMQPFGVGTIDGAWFTDLAGIPSGAGVIPTANVPQNSFNAQSFTAAAAVTKGQALILGNGKTGYLTANNQTGSSSYAIQTLLNAPTPGGQTFVTSPSTTAIRACLGKFTTSTGSTITITAAIYATSGNVPTGSALGTATAALAASTTQALTFTFASPIAVSPSTQYAVVFSASTFSGQTTSLIYNTSGYGSQYFVTNNGSSWSSNSGESAWIEIWEVITTAGQVQPSDTTQTAFSTDVYDLVDNFCGFALASVSAGQSVSVNLGPIDADQSGLTAGAEYYLNGSAGAIATTAGAVTVKAGLAMSSTQILIKFENHP